MVRLRPLAPTDLPTLLALQHAQAGAGPRWSAERLARELHHPARAHGRNVVIAERDGAVAGGAGWVEAGAEMFGSPVLAADAEAAAALLAQLAARARALGAARLRCSASPIDAPKIAALREAGFAPLFDFITLARPAAPVAAPDLPLRRVPVADHPAAALLELHNQTFAGVPNAAPMSAEELTHELAGLWPEAAAVWLDERGEAAAFLFATRAPDHAVVEAVGVREAWRGRGVGRLAVGHLLATAAAAGLPEARALIASTNEASLRLHQALGFAERTRVTSWQLVLG